MIPQFWLEKLISLQTQFTARINQYQSNNPYLFRFWQDSFTRYLKKMKLPEFPSPKHPRRYFHLTAVDFLLYKSKANIIWNLCPGNIKTLLPAIDRWITRKNTQDPLLWINIDILPELQRFNTDILEKYWKIKPITLHDHMHAVEYKQSLIVNLQGSIEDFPVIYNDLELKTLHEQQILLCVDGFPNAIIPPAKILVYWNSFQKFIISNFQGWYFTWLNAESLETKFTFYFDVVLEKHGHPIFWLEVTPLKYMVPNNNLEIYHEFVVALPLAATTFSEIQQQSSGETAGWIFRFFTDSAQTNLVYQAMYVNPEALKVLINIEDFSDKYIVSSYQDIDRLLFPLHDNASEIKQSGFTKTLPVLAIKQLKKSIEKEE